ncbi:MAG: MBOAT family protein [Betaproteobacteria bacterium]|nr:MBOAT family protein [Betaproteobacteria bacterium]
MLFNSDEFLFLFLPITVCVFFALGTFSRTSAIRWLAFASLVFYAWWRPVNALIIAPSILVNFFLASVLLRLNQKNGSSRAATAVLLLGIAFNVVFLGIFKYTDFVFGTINDVFSANLVLQHIILPLGISFITFQKIAFLVDVHAGRVRSFSFQDYCTFVLFFPQLIAGPIVHYREMMPQFHAASCRLDASNTAVGLTLLIFGLFKKVILADNVAPFVSPIFEHVAAGGHPSMLLAWMAAIGFTLQIYFDFSGYTDMALGLARLFGIRLPPNFDSPLRASSIIDFWLRWHMTLTRFLTAYIYNPLVLRLTRRRAAKGLPGFSGKNATIGAFVSLLMAPTLLTMFVSGLWHGAGYGFVCWGLIHGAYLSINHAWRAVSWRLWRNRAAYDRVMKPAGLVLTFVSVTAAMIFFRAPTLSSAIDLLRGFFGLNGVALPQFVFDRLGPLSAMLHHMGISVETWGASDFVHIAMWVVLLTFIALACPNTLQILSRYEPALGVRPCPARFAVGGITLPEWSPSIAWAVAISGIAGLTIVFLGGPSEFLYWQF